MGNDSSTLNSSGADCSVLLPFEPAAAAAAAPTSGAALGLGRWPDMVPACLSQQLGHLHLHSTAAANKHSMALLMQQLQLVLAAGLLTDCRVKGCMCCSCVAHTHQETIVKAPQAGTTIVSRTQLQTCAGGMAVSHLQPSGSSSNC